MHKIYNNELPQTIQKRFIKTEQVHSHDTRLIEKCNYFLPRVSKFIC